MHFAAMMTSMMLIQPNFLDLPAFVNDLQFTVRKRRNRRKCRCNKRRNRRRTKIN